MMIEGKKQYSPDTIKIDATYVITSMEGASFFTTSGTVREELLGEIKTIIHEFTRKFGLTPNNSYSSAPSATILSNVLKDMGLRNIEDYSEQSGSQSEVS